MLLLFFFNLNNKKDQPIWIGKSELKAETETMKKKTNPQELFLEWTDLCELINHLGVCISLLTKSVFLYSFLRSELLVAVIEHEH